MIWAWISENRRATLLAVYFRDARKNMAERREKRSGGYSVATLQIPFVFILSHGVLTYNDLSSTRLRMFAMDENPYEPLHQTNPAGQGVTGGIHVSPCGLSGSCFCSSLSW